MTMKSFQKIVLYTSYKHGIKDWITKSRTYCIQQCNYASGNRKHDPPRYF